MVFYHNKWCHHQKKNSTQDFFLAQNEAIWWKLKGSRVGTGTDLSWFTRVQFGPFRTPLVEVAFTKLEGNKTACDSSGACVFRIWEKHSAGSLCHPKTLLVSVVIQAFLVLVAISHSYWLLRTPVNRWMTIAYFMVKKGTKRFSSTSEDCPPLPTPLKILKTTVKSLLTNQFNNLLKDWIFTNQVLKLYTMALISPVNLTSIYSWLHSPCWARCWPGFNARYGLSDGGPAGCWFRVRFW